MLVSLWADKHTMYVLIPLLSAGLTVRLLTPVAFSECKLPGLSCSYLLGTLCVHVLFLCDASLWLCCVLL